jgi:hypothetical protein
MIPKELDAMFSYDLLILKSRLIEPEVVHLTVDLTQLGEERMAIVGNWSEQVEGKIQPAHAVLFSGSVTSKEAKEQLRAVNAVTSSLGIGDKLGHLIADEGRDVVGKRNGLFVLLASDTKMKELISCDLHINNRAFSVSCLNVFGHPKANEPSALQLLCLIHYCLSTPWEKWRSIIANYLSDQSNVKPPQSLITRWYTVVRAAIWTIERRSALIRLAADVWY